GFDGLPPVRLRRPDVPRQDVSGPFQLALLDQVEQDLVVGHEHAARLVHDGRVAQLLVGVPGGQDGDGRLVDGRVAEAGVEVAGDVRGWGGPADAAPADGGADEGGVPPVVLRDHRPGEVEGRAGDVGVEGHA